MKVSAIETSCDETSIALLEKTDENKYKILSHETISQINLHREFGGVFPTLSRREHEKNLVPILIKTLCNSNLDYLSPSNYSRILNSNDEAFYDEMLNRYPELEKQFSEFADTYDYVKIGEHIDAIAVTNGPGLPPALWVGVNFSKCLAKLFGGGEKEIPIYPINHMEGHILAALAKACDDKKIGIEKPSFPMLSLLISGGHTEFVISNEPFKYEKIGETQDDAVGECFDKVARMLELPYPGGPEIGKLAEKGRKENVKYEFKFPRPMLHTKDFNFSFSGLKTHILYFLNDLKSQVSEDLKVNIATEFEYTVRDILFEKSKKAILGTNAKSFVVGGGVISSPYLRSELVKLEEETGCKVYLSDKQMATDNALMIALVAMTQIENKKPPSRDFLAIGSKNYNWN
jgi:N6-L-threonylcarbamoyladenine synthase